MRKTDTVKKSVAICWIGIGDYNIMFKDFYESFKAHFCPECDKTFYVFTDQPFTAFGLQDCKTYMISNACQHRAYVRFRKFFYILLAEDKLLQHDYAAYMNGNMVCQKDVHLEDFLPAGKKYAAVEHPYNKPFLKGQMYGVPDSMASCKPSETFLYKQSGWIFCTAIEMLRMANTIEGWFRTDKAKGLDAFIPMHDETYYNKYIMLHANETSLLKAADWLCPSSWSSANEAKMVQLDKKSLFAANGKKLEENSPKDLYQMPRC